MSVQRYRKKPVEIEAMQYDGRNTVEVAEWLRASDVKVGWSNAAMIIPTLEGRMEASPGDWIIRGVKGEFYPCRADIFEATYEASEQAEAIDRMGPAAGCAYCVGAGGYEDYDGEWCECSCQRSDRGSSETEELARLRLERLEAVEDFITRHYLDTQMGERVLAIVNGIEEVRRGD